MAVVGRRHEPTVEENASRIVKLAADAIDGSSAPWFVRTRHQMHVFVAAAMTDPLSLQRHVLRRDGFLTDVVINEVLGHAKHITRADEFTGCNLLGALSRFLLNPDPLTLEDVQKTTLDVKEEPEPPRSADDWNIEWKNATERLISKIKHVVVMICGMKPHASWPMRKWTSERDPGMHMAVLSHMVYACKSIVESFPALSPSDPRRAGSPVYHERLFAKFTGVRAFVEETTRPGVELNPAAVLQAVEALAATIELWAEYRMGAIDMSRRRGLPFAMHSLSLGE